MSFLHPFILGVGLSAVAIPIIIHFIRRRRRPIEWAAMRFLQDAMRKRRRRLRLEQLLLLLTRCAIVALLALAIARPISGSLGSDEPGVHILAIDNSIRAATTTPDGRSDLERSVEQALALIERAQPGDTFAVLALGNPDRPALWPPTADPDAARRALERLRPTDAPATLDPIAHALASSTDSLGGSPDADTTRAVTLHLISAWRATDLLEPAPGSAQTPIPEVSTVLLHQPTIPLTQTPLINIGIQRFEVSTPTVVGAGSLAPPTMASGVLLRSGGLDARTAGIELIAYPGGTIAGRAVARFEPGASTATWSAALDNDALTPGRGGRIAIETTLVLPKGVDANPRDNSARRVIVRQRELRAAIVERPPIDADARLTQGTWLRAALSPDERAGIDSFRIDPASLGSLPPGSIDAMFILEPTRVDEAGWTRAAELVARGGLVVVTPSPLAEQDATGTDWTERLAHITDGQIRVSTDAGVREEPTRLAPDRPGGLLGALGSEFAELAGTVSVMRRIVLDCGPETTALLASTQGDTLLAQWSPADTPGSVVAGAFALDIQWTDLPARPVFVPIVQELVRRGSGRGIDADHTAGTLTAALPDTPGVDRWEQDSTLAPSVHAGTHSAADTGAHAGVWLGLNIDGAVIRTHTITPDAQAAQLGGGTVEPIADDLEQAITDRFPGARFERDTPGSDRPHAQAASAWGDRIALLMLTACAALAVFEAMLARSASHPAGASP